MAKYIIMHSNQGGLLQLYLLRAAKSRVTENVIDKLAFCISVLNSADYHCIFLEFSAQIWQRTASTLFLSASQYQFIVKKCLNVALVAQVGTGQTA